MSVNPMTTMRNLPACAARLIPALGLLALITANGCTANHGGLKPKHWDQTRRDATLQLAQENIAAGQFDRARGALASFAETPDPEIRAALARCDVEEGRYDDALRRLDGIEPEADNARLHWLRGVALEGLGHWNEAAAAYGQTFSLEPGAAILVAWLDALVLDGRDAEAAEILARERTRFPGEPVILLLAARLADSRGEFTTAIDELKTTLLAEPDSATIRRKLAVTLMRAGRYDEAVNEWQRLIDLSDRPEARHALRRQMASCLLAAGRSDEARQVYQVLIAAKSDDAAARLGYATACLKANQPRAALENALQLVRDDPRNELARALAGLCYERLGDSAQANEFLSGSRDENVSE